MKIHAKVDHTGESIHLVHCIKMAKFYCGPVEMFKGTALNTGDG